MAATTSASRWVEVTPSQFPHEADGLELVRGLLPDETPYRAWSNFEFRDSHGRWHEVDLLVLARDGFHLVELKYYSGTIRGNDLTWLRDGHRAEDSPLKLARRKAQYFASKLRDEFDAWVREQKIANAPRANEVIPYVQESVFLHHPRTRVELPEAARRDLYGLDGAETSTGLPGISELLLQPSGPRGPIPASREKTLCALLDRIGLVQRREREAGSWVLDGAAIAEGEGWQDWLASHKVSQQERRRIRFQTLPPGAGSPARQRVRQLAEHEYRVMRRLTHDGVLRPDDLVDCELGVGLVYPYDPDARPLDLWLADRPGGVPLETQLAILRQVGDALSYAHGNRLVHRGLSPRAILVSDKGGRLRVLVADWQSVGAIRAEGTRAPSAGVTALIGADLTPQALAPDAERWLRDAFAAPESLRDAAADRVRLDVFGLGALAFYILTGVPAARSTAELRERVQRQNGLDVSIERPEVSPALREAILRATRPRVSDRTPDVSAFLAHLDATAATSEESLDPLEAAPGTLLDGRFRLLRRLGAGSTAVGLLVTDTTAGEGAPERVLKVALDDPAARRLAEEAEVLSQLHHPRLVNLIEGPIEVGGRTALLLSNAGRDTLATELRQRPRLSLDLLERWGTDLLEALVALDKAGVDHRDIKPSNLGVAANPGNRAKHLVLFDFSLTRAAASATSAGTPPYLDPFLVGARDRFDSAAERYAAAVVLFEMATGHTPVYGDGLSDPASIPDEASIAAADFDPAVGTALVRFFTRALARQAEGRHDTAAEMLRSWQVCFPAALTTIADNAAQLAEAATLDTRLAKAGLSARGLSALEPFHVQTVGDLLAVDPARLSRLSGTAEPTRVEVKQRAREWRQRLGAPTRPHGWQPRRAVPTLPGPHEVADLLLAVARKGRNATRASLVSHILGLTGQVDAFATQGLLAASLPEPVTSARVNQLLSGLQVAWAENDDSLRLIKALHETTTARLAELGRVATAEELGRHLLAQLVADPQADDAAETRLAEGLLRFVVERDRAAARGEDDGTGWNTRRREGQPLLVATDPILLDVAEALGRSADSLVAAVNPTGHDTLVGAARAGEALTGVLGRAVVPDALRDPARLVRLAAATSRRCGASATHDLHDLQLPAARALALTLPTVAAGQKLDPTEIRDRVRARFPTLPRLPERPRLDQVVAESGLGLVFDERLRAYRPVVVAGETTGLETRHATVLATDTSPVALLSATGNRLAESLTKRSFLALGVPATHLDRAVAMLADSYAADVLDLTQVLLDEMRRQADAGRLPWPAVLSADADPETSRAAHGLRVLVDRSLPAVTAAIEDTLSVVEPPSSPVELVETKASSVVELVETKAASAVEPPSSVVEPVETLAIPEKPAQRPSPQTIPEEPAQRPSSLAIPEEPAQRASRRVAPADTQPPLVLTDAALLSRYGALNLLARWCDVATSRPRAVWLVVPQLHANQGAVVDGRPLPLSAPGQFVRLAGDWIDSRRLEGTVA